MPYSLRFHAHRRQLLSPLSAVPATPYAVAGLPIDKARKKIISLSCPSTSSLDHSLLIPPPLAPRPELVLPIDRHRAYRKANFDPHPEDRPLIVQFCGHDPALLLASAKFVEKDCDAVDLNLVRES